MYFDNRYTYDFTMHINTICDKQTGIVYNKGGYMSTYGDGVYTLNIPTEENAKGEYAYKLSIDFHKRTGTFIRRN